MSRSSHTPLDQELPKRYSVPNRYTGRKIAYILVTIYAEFRGASLVPHDPEVILFKLHVQLRTLTLPTRSTVN
jgi:hypothetical protein